MSTRLQHRDTPVQQILDLEGVNAAISKKHVASVLYTYRCSLRCLHCCFNSHPALPDVHVGLHDAVEYLRQLHTTDRCIHIAGGEAMLYWPELLDVCRVAAEEGVAPHFIESNTTWCTSDAVTHERLSLLKEAGVRGLLISSDPYHQLDCPPERFMRCRDAALSIFGPENVAGALPDEQVLEHARIAHDPKLFDAFARESRVMLSGRAGDALMCYHPDRPLDDLADDTMWHGPDEGMCCRKEFEPEEMWEVHIDPYGNVQTCCGIIVGNVRVTPLPELWERGFLANPLVAAVHDKGPLGLLPYATERGYTPRDGYPQKCGMCWELRRFLRPHFPETIGPEEVYPVL